MKFEAPQIIYFCFVIVALVSSGYNHGKIIYTRHNMFKVLFSMLIQFFLILWGGFFHVFSYPQIIYMFLFGMTFGVAIYKHDKLNTKPEDITIDILSFIILAILLYFGGFFTYN